MQDMACPAGYGRAGQGTVVQGRARQGWAGLGWARQGRTGYGAERYRISQTRVPMAGRDVTEKGKSGRRGQDRAEPGSAVQSRVGNAKAMHETMQDTLHYRKRQRA